MTPDEIQHCENIANDLRIPILQKLVSEWKAIQGNPSVTLAELEQDGTIGTWRCQYCGDMQDPMSTDWYWDGRRWWHRHAGIGEFPTRRFGFHDR